MEETSLTTRREEIDKFVNDKSVLNLVDSILYLDGIKPYIGLSHNGEVGEFLQQKGISIVHNKEDFDYLYDSLKNRITSLEGKDGRATTYIQKAEYQHQLGDIATKLSKLEQTVNVGFEDLEEPFKAVLNYVWEAVINQGFEMEKEKPKIRIGKNEKGETNRGITGIEIKISNLEIYGFKEKSFFELVEREEKVLGIFKKTITEEIEKIKEVEGVDFFISTDWNPHSSQPLKEYLQSLKDKFVHGSDGFQTRIGNDIKSFLELPKRINGYIEEQQSKITKIINGFKREE